MTLISIHALREEGDVDRQSVAAQIFRFLSTPSARRATFRHFDAHNAPADFYPRPPRGGRPATTSPRQTAKRFLSTPSARRATHRTCRATTAVLFLSTPSARRATGGAPLNVGLYAVFLSTPSARRATGLSYEATARDMSISIHALREEGDQCPHKSRFGTKKFLSTPSARRATRSRTEADKPFSNFYPRPPRGGRRRFYPPKPDDRHFYPRPPRGGRLPLCTASSPQPRFLSTPSARRATAKTETKSLFSYKLYNILHEFRRALIYNGSKNYPNHAK